MSKRMLIDGTHPEETRVVVTTGSRLEEYDVETSTKKQLKGNIYLAKVTRVEPSLQAAFVDFGGNRHGFLAFNEIHPDYYQIPIEDRRALLEEQANLDLNATAAQAHVDEIDGEVSEREDLDEPDDADASEDAVSADGEADEEQAAEDAGDHDDAESADDGDADEDDDEDDEVKASDGNGSSRRRQRFHRRYRIQEVIKRRQILLVQVVKEERGNKGAALTTYISLAGRYCVLMPNTGRGGGISRKVTNTTSRRKLRDILKSLEIPEGMGVIMRTAGMERSKSEIKRDFDYLIRSWDTIRELTLQSTAPTLIYEEANLIKRAIRDLYSKDIDEVLIEGAEPYQTAKKFMRLLMPSHAKRVQQYRDDTIPLFHRFQVESHLDAMLDPVVQLKSGGYIVIHSTEALVAIDVNSGRSTRERNIEETALKTNIEAAEEVARQLRLRDLAGLIVIDFIDMEVSRNPRKVEKALKEAMSGDRARIQIGRISAFGLLELSRQRLRPSLQEASTEICPHCQGVGYVRSTESMAVRVLRALEEEGIRQRSSEVTVTVPTSVALYILNKKRNTLLEIEQRYRFNVSIEGDDRLPASEFSLERIRARAADDVDESIVLSIESVAESGAADAAPAPEKADEQEEGRQRKPRRRRRSRKSDDEAAQEPEEEVAVEAAPAEEEAVADEDAEKAPAKRRRRGKRGGRRRSRRGKDAPLSATPHEDAINATFAWAKADVEPPAETTEDGHGAAIEATFAWPSADAEPVAPKGGNGALAKTSVAEEEPAPAEPEEIAESEPAPPEPEAEPEPAPEPEAEPAELATADAPAEVQAPPPEVVSDKPKRRGWWQKFTE